MAPPVGPTQLGHGYECLQGGGEMGAYMREFDWAGSPIGPVEQWPQSLRTCVRIILTSRQPMFVWWGEQLINLYNDAYISILGGKHPQFRQAVEKYRREQTEAVLANPDPRGGGQK